MEYLCKNEDETREVARKLAQQLPEGSVVLLTGELGAGKTLFANAFAGELGIVEHLLSPTFTIVREYDGLYHFDLYRLEDEDELFEIGFEEYINSGKYCLIEWADKFPHVFGEDAVRVRIEYCTDGRKIVVG